MASCLCWSVEPHFFFTPFARPTKGWIFVCLPWGVSQVGNPPLVAACALRHVGGGGGATLKIVFRLANLTTCFRVTQNFTNSFLPKFYIFFLVIARGPLSSASFRLMCVIGHSCRNVIPIWYEHCLQCQQNRSKATLWLLHKFQLFEGAQDVVARLRAVCCILLPYNPYRLPHHYKRHIRGLFCSCKYRFLWLFPIFEH